ncbi:MAG: hypothetical protein V4556_02745 [Bacteroidota bacterium]
MRSILLPFIFSLITLTAFSQTYTFTGNGNWSIASNWSNNIIPPATLPSGDTIYISSATMDSCILDVTQTISEGAFFIISSGANFIVRGKLNIKNKIPTVTTIAVTNKFGCSFQTGGNILSDGGSSITAKGVVGTVSPFVIPNTGLYNFTTIDGSGNSSFISSPNVIPGATYSIRAYATNSVGTAYGNTVEVIIPFPTIYMETRSPIAITNNSAISGGLPEGQTTGCNFYTVGVVWDTLPLPNVSLQTKTMQPMVKNQYFISTITGLLPNTMYYVRSYAHPISGSYTYGPISYGPQLSFTTLP